MSTAQSEVKRQLVNFIAPKELAARFTEAAKQDDRSRSSALRQAMRVYIETASIREETPNA
jgi:metal-responsive CopG/Arc/MetJ family transcriptional regulator